MIFVYIQYTLSSDRRVFAWNAGHIYQLLGLVRAQALNDGVDIVDQAQAQISFKQNDRIK